MPTNLERVQEIMREIFDDDELEISNETTAADVPEWDSLAHVNLIVASEKAFGVKFLASEIGQLRSPDQNVGSFLKMLEAKLG